MNKAVTLSAFLIATFFAGSASLLQAQEGHPFDGTWRGELNRNGESLPVVVIMDYDGDNITGMINPGRNSYRFSEAEHDAPNWRVTVNTENRQGEAVMFTGVMHEIGARNRYIEGSWNQAGMEYAFRITRE
jgi:hypothetical protein